MTGDELRTRREALGLSQAKLAARLNMTSNALAKWERGLTRIAHPGMLDLALRALEHERISARCPSTP